MSRLEWMDDALCREVDQDLFFPENPIESQRARKICASCRVRSECLEYALETRVDGIWGGTTAVQRQKMRGAAYRRLAS